MKKRILCLLLAALILSGCAGGSGITETTEETKMASNHDGVLNLLMVGSSYCFYYVEELYDLLMQYPPEGITEVNVYNLYYSGCKLTQHLNWWRQGEANYDFYKVDATGRKKLDSFDKWSLDQALVMADWDFISLQGTPAGYRFWRDDAQEIATQSAALAEPILDHFHEKFPRAKLLWHRTWIPEVGRVDTSGHTYIAEEVPVYNAAMGKVCHYLCDEFAKNKPYDLTMVPTGLAWVNARARNEKENLLLYGGLCARLGKNSFGNGTEHCGDGTHDGDIGGGQYLNACVWFEVITGQSCLGNTYRPVYSYGGQEYTLSEELVAMLQNAAHDAVEAVKAPGSDA